MDPTPVKFPPGLAASLGAEGVHLVTRIVHAGGYGLPRRGLTGAARNLATRLMRSKVLASWEAPAAVKPVRAYTLSIPLAAALGLRLDGPRRRWLAIDGPGVGQTRVRPGKLALETDLGFDLEAIPSPPPQAPDRRADDGGLKRPTLLVGVDLIWNGPSDATGNHDGTCRACNGELRRPGHYCLIEDTCYGDPVFAGGRRWRTQRT